MAWYRVGTVNVTSGSKNVAGVGTDWLSLTGTAQVSNSFVGPDGRLYEVAAVLAADLLQLVEEYKGTTSSALSYAIMPTMGLTAELARQVGLLIQKGTGGLAIKGVKGTYAQLLEVTGSVSGDAWVVGAETQGELYFWTGSGWFDVGPLNSTPELRALRDETINAKDAAVTARDIAAFGGFSVADLRSIDVSVRETVDIASVVAGWQATATGALGGGTFRWDAARPKSQHNGGTIVSPTVPWNGNASTLGSFLDGSGETDAAGVGCWVRIYRDKDSIDACWFGARPESIDNQVPVNAALRVGGRIAVSGGLIRTSNDVVSLSHTDLRVHKKSTLQCHPSHIGVALVLVPGNVTTDAEDIRIGGGGTYDANGIVIAAIKVNSGRRIKLDPTSIINCVKHGIHIGSQLATQACVDINVMRGVRINYKTGGMNAADG